MKCVGCQFPRALKCDLLHYLVELWSISSSKIMSVLDYILNYPWLHKQPGCVVNIRVVNETEQRCNDKEVIDCGMFLWVSDLISSRIRRELLQ